MLRSPASLSKRFLTATSLAVLTTMPTVANGVTLTPQFRAMSEASVGQGANTQPWLIADKDDDDDDDKKERDRRGRGRDRDDDDDDDDDRGNRRRQERVKYERSTQIRVQEVRGWRSYVSVARLVNSNSLVMQLNVLNKPVTQYANAVYIVYARQNNQWVQVYTSTGARLIASQAGRVALQPEVIRLDQLQLGRNIDYSRLELKVDAQIRYDGGGRRDQQVVFEQPCNYGSLSQINRVEQISTITTTSSTTTSTGGSTQTGGRQSVTLTNGYRVTFLGVNYTSSTSIWRYYVEELPVAQDLSNWVLGLPSCARVVNASPRGEWVNPDPNARISGIKWQPGGGFVKGEFSVTLNGRWAIGTTTVAVKGPDVARGQLSGPSCSSI